MREFNNALAFTSARTAKNLTYVYSHGRNAIRVRHLRTCVAIKLRAFVELLFGRSGRRSLHFMKRALLVGK